MWRVHIGVLGRSVGVGNKSEVHCPMIAFRRQFSMFSGPLKGPIKYYLHKYSSYQLIEKTTIFARHDVKKGCYCAFFKDAIRLISTMEFY